MALNKLAIHICISGFTQNESSTHGVFTLSEKLARASHACQHNSRVWLCTWDSRWHHVAEHIWLLWREYTDSADDLAINIYGYSWGAGWGAVRLATQLEQRGLPVRVAVLCDPVYRHPNPIFRWYSLLGRDWWVAPRIIIPANVARVVTFNQRHNHPQGHLVTAAGRATVVDAPVELDRIHQYMDDAREWHDACLREAGATKATLLTPNEGANHGI